VNLFPHDRLEDARKVYEFLFELVGTIEETADVFPGDEIDIREERARYCRCVYETSEKGDRLDAFADAMEFAINAVPKKFVWQDKFLLSSDTVSRLPASVLPNAAHRFSAYEYFRSSKIISGSLKKNCSHSQFST